MCPVCRSELSLNPADSSLDATQQAAIRAVDDLASDHFGGQYLFECDRESRYPVEAMRALAKSGWAALAVPKEYGGEAGSALDLVVVHQAIARHSLAVAQAYYSLWVLGADAIERMGTRAQRDHWLPRIARGEASIAFAMTEPGSGSDAASLATKGTMNDDGDFVVRGQKVFITGAAVANRIITVVRTEADADRHSGLSLLMVDPAAPGVTVRPMKKIGLRALDLCEVFLDDVVVSAGELVGTAGHAWRELRLGLAKERLFLAAISVGAMQDVVERSTSYARDRRAFGQPIGGFQLVADKIVRMRMSLDAATALVRDAARRLDAGDPSATVAASVAKLFCTEAYVTATREGAQVFGGYGFIDEYPIARHYRDAKYLEIGGGTSQVQTIVIARSMGLLG